MSYSETKLDEVITQTKQITADIPMNQIERTPLDGFFVYKGTQCGGKQKAVYQPAMFILVQGKKIGYAGGETFDISVGRYISLFLPIAWEVEVLEASEEAPLIMVGIKIDLSRIANILMKIDRANTTPQSSPDNKAAPSGIYSKPLTDPIIDTLNRILNTINNPVEREVLGDALLDELYFRLICNDESGALQHLLHHRGQIPQISKAVTHIHQNLNEVVSVNSLANMVNMSPSGFRKAFRDVMHMPPLQYAKSIKLDRAQTFIQSGKNASEAGYLVGYNSPAQFSREYKRHFGFTPSETRI